MCHVPGLFGFAHVVLNPELSALQSPSTCWAAPEHLLGLCWIYVGVLLAFCVLPVGYIAMLCEIPVGFMLAGCRIVMLHSVCEVR